jgi:hypothetical protein
MEQLVHLRLKSIYKAFKQSSRSPKNESTTLDADEDAIDEDDCDDVEDTQILLQAAATAASIAHHHNSTSNDGSSSMAGVAASSSTNQAKEMVDKYMAEKKRADAAAEALLTELEQEERAVKSKKTKKKKKKQRQQAKKDEEEKQDEEEEEEELPEETTTTKPRANEKPPPQSQQAMPPKETAVTTDKKSSLQKTAPTKEYGKTPSKKSATNNSSRSSSKSATETSSDANSEKSESVRSEPAVPPSPPVEIDPVEKKLCALVEAEDVDGIEELLNELKGVPGRAALRKNAKKALKRLRPTEDEDVVKEEPPKYAEEPQPTTTRLNIQVDHPGELLKVVSETNNKVYGKKSATGVPRSKAQTGPPKVECIMQMSPAVVGWVIGKGGQRIRDLMEESGAKIWIEQDNMKNAHDPRTVYVSGARKCVDHAVRLVKDLVAKAPLDGAAPPSAENEAAAPSQAAASAPVPKANAANAIHNGPRRQTPLAPPVEPNPTTKAENLIPPVQLAPPPHLQTGVLNDILGTTPQRSDLPEAGPLEHVLTCDPRFVPLLIGRRGWTIKHIQDSSGARVDIDQTVTPRRIKISGSEKEVETAIQMVRDVLSYPHAQLQAGGGGMDGTAPLNDIPQQQMAIGHSDAVGYQNLRPTLSSQTEDRNHTPPPSSLFMTGDSKSAISASSSLSSTPEPSMASSSKLYSGQLQTGLMTAQDYGINNYHPSPAGMGNAFLHHDMGLGDMSGAHGPAGIGPNGTPVYGGGHIGMHQNQGYGMQSHAHPYGQAPGYKPAVPLGSNILHEQHPGGLEGMAPHLGLRSDANSNMQQTRPLDFSGIPRRGNPVPLHQQSAFGSSPAQFRHQEPLPDGGFQNMMSMGPCDNVNRSAYNPGPDPAAPSSLWNRGTSPSVPGRGQPEAADGFYLESLRLQNQTAPGTNHPLPINFDVAPSVGDRRGGLATGANPLGIGRDDSLMVDSLFGPTTGTTSGADRQNLLTGFQGLSINGGESLGSGVWGSSLPGWEGDHGNKGCTVAPVDPVASTLFSGLQPPQAPEEQQHPAQSRFHWGSTNA